MSETTTVSIGSLAKQARDDGVRLPEIQRPLVRSRKDTGCR